MITVKVTRSTGVIPLGKQGENLAREIVFDISGWVAEYGDGTAVLLVQRNGDSTPYPATVTLADGIVTWPVTNADTANAGTGKCELQYIVDEVVVKSATCKFVVVASLEEAGEAPDPESGWVADLLQSVADAVTAASATTPPVYNLEEMGIASVALVGGSMQITYDTTDLIADLKSGPVTFAINLISGSTTIPISMTGYAACGEFSGSVAYEMTQVFYYGTNILISVVIYEAGMVQVITTAL